MVPACLEAVEKVNDPAVFVLLDAHRVLDDSAGLRRLRDHLAELSKRRQILVLVGPLLELPLELARETGRVALPLPTARELRGLFERHAIDVVDLDRGSAVR